MKKILVLCLLFVSVTLSAQFKLGVTAGGGVGSKSTVTPLDSFKFVGSLGISAEVRYNLVFFRTGVVFQNDNRTFVPLHLFVRTTPAGGFLGGGVSLATNKGKSMYDIILGRKMSRNIDIALQYSHPLQGVFSESILGIHLTFYPFTTCGDNCEL